MDTLVLRKTTEFISSDLSSSPQPRSSLKLKSLTPDLKMTFRKIEQVRDYYLNQIDSNSKPGSKQSSNRKTRIQGLEDLGIFSEFGHSKKIYSENIKTNSPRTIHITDFMRKDQKMKLLQLAGQCKAYESKKEAYKKELFGRELVFKNFFFHTEKNPGFFNTPQASPRGFKDIDRKESVRVVASDKTVKLDKIIDKCNQVIAGKAKFNWLVIRD